MHQVSIKSEKYIHTWSCLPGNINLKLRSIDLGLLFSSLRTYFIADLNSLRHLQPFCILNYICITFRNYAKHLVKIYTDIRLETKKITKSFYFLLKSQPTLLIYHLITLKICIYLLWNIALDKFLALSEKFKTPT